MTCDDALDDHLGLGPGIAAVAMGELAKDEEVGFGERDAQDSHGAESRAGAVAVIALNWRQLP